MKATIFSTEQIVTIDAIGHRGMTQARVWEGVTEGGIRFVAYIPLVQVKSDDDNAEFEKALSEHKKPDSETRHAINRRLLS